MDTAFVARTANAWSWIERRAKRIIRKEGLPISSMTSSRCSLNWVIQSKIISFKWVRTIQNSQQRWVIKLRKESTI